MCRSSVFDGIVNQVNLSSLSGLHSRTSVARTLMARLPGLFQTHS